MTTILLRKNCFDTRLRKVSPTVWLIGISEVTVREVPIIWPEHVMSYRVTSLYGNIRGVDYPWLLVNMLKGCRSDIIWKKFIASRIGYILYVSCMCQNLSLGMPIEKNSLMLRSKQGRFIRSRLKVTATQKVFIRVYVFGRYFETSVTAALYCHRSLSVFSTRKFPWKCFRLGYLIDRKYVWITK